MFRYLPIRKVHARQVLDSRGNPTIEVEVTVGEGIIGLNGYTGKAIVPSGASTGKFEAVELRDGDKENYRGFSVEQAVHNVNLKLAEAVIGENALNQNYIDTLLIEADGTENKQNIGANAILGVSLATAKAAAKALRIPLYQYLGGCHIRRLPVPMMNILNGGKHAENRIDFQEFMIMPVCMQNMEEAVHSGVKVYHVLKEILKSRNMTVAVGDEGGFAPELENTEEALEVLVTAIQKAGYRPGEDIMIALDAAASELYDREKKAYIFSGETDRNGNAVERTTEQMIAYYERLSREYPIISIEDGLDEEDWSGWIELTKRLGKKIQLVGDDLFVTNPKRLCTGIGQEVANAILIKVNQIGTLTEAMEAITLAKENKYRTIISHRSGETEDSFIADLAVAVGAGQIKTGAPCRSDRNAKYNQLLRISELLGKQAVLRNPFEFR